MRFFISLMNFFFVFITEKSDIGAAIAPPQSLLEEPPIKSDGKAEFC